MIRAKSNSSRTRYPASWDYGKLAGRPGSRSSAGNGRKISKDYIDREFRLGIESFFGSHLGRGLLAWLSRDRRGGTLLERMICSYGDSTVSLKERILFWPAHRLIRWLKGPVSDERFREKVAEHSSTVRGIVATGRSVAEFGLTLPQKFLVPLFVVWNFTNQCNLRCRHCYQSSGAERGADELSLQERLAVVDELGKAYVPMIAFAGGEPTIDKDLIPVLERCKHYGIHTTVATNGTTLTLGRVQALRNAGVRYVEISLDSTDPDEHDAFRGAKGAWELAVQGIRNVVATDRIRAGVAMCVQQGNYHQVEEMIDLAKSLGASCFAHFNFIPVGRGKNCAKEDLSPAQRERLLRMLNDQMQEGSIGVLSTAPQFGRVALAWSPVQGRMSASHCGGSGGLAARVVAKYLGGCGAGRTYVCLEPNGEVTPCVYMPDRPFGNVREERLLDIFRDSPYWDTLWNRSDRGEHCQVCRYKNYCGGCRARADAYFGSLRAGDPGCIFNQASWDKLVEAKPSKQEYNRRHCQRCPSLV